MNKNVVLFLWVLGSTAGFYFLYQHSYTAGEPANLSLSTIKSPITPPFALGIEKLLVFVHPQCPCSQATISELEILVPSINPRAQVRVVFFKPKTRPIEWAKNDLWNEARRIPGVTTEIDEDGVKAEKYGVHTSGQSLLYASDGNLVFSGGITKSRGHLGDNSGAEAIKTYFRKYSQNLIQTPVFGCSIKNPERAIAGAKP